MTFRLLSKSPDESIDSLLSTLLLEQKNKIIPLSFTEDGVCSAVFALKISHRNNLSIYRVIHYIRPDDPTGAVYYTHPLTLKIKSKNKYQFKGRTVGCESQRLKVMFKEKKGKVVIKWQRGHYATNYFHLCTV